MPLNADSLWDGQRVGGWSEMVEVGLGGGGGGGGGRGSF